MMSSGCCASCGGPLVTISINVGAGQRVMCSCARCDSRWWHSEGRVTTLAGVIGDLGDPVGQRPYRRA